MLKNSLQKVASEGLAVIGFVLIVLPYIPYLDVSKNQFGLVAIALATLSFFISTKQPSMAVAIFLLMTGIVVITPSLYFFLASLPAFSGSIIGVSFGAWILALGILKIKNSTKRGASEGLAKSSQIHRSALGISKISILVIVLVIIAGGTLAAIVLPSLSQPSSATACNSASSQSAVQISITSGSASSSGAPGYNPDAVTLVIGVNNTIVWKNDDSAHHTVTTSSTPSGSSFDSGNIPSGSCYTHTFSTAGTYKYSCSYHPWMTGTTIVEPAS